nr:hypothetical transcript [Hymenolepis microstoma]
MAFVLLRSFQLKSACQIWALQIITVSKLSASLERRYFDACSIPLRGENIDDLLSVTTFIQFLIEFVYCFSYSGALKH